MHESSSCSLSSPAFGAVSFGYFNKCVVPCCFNVYFSDNIWYGASFHMLIYQLSIFFVEVSVKVFVFFNRIVFLLLSFNSSLCILENRSLLDASFANISPQSVVCLLILLTLSFAYQKLLVLMKSSSSIISVKGHALKSHYYTQVMQVFYCVIF